jgi:hypothetical protein
MDEMVTAGADANALAKYTQERLRVFLKPSVEAILSEKGKTTAEYEARAGKFKADCGKHRGVSEAMERVGIFRAPSGTRSR